MQSAIRLKILENNPLSLQAFSHFLIQSQDFSLSIPSGISLINCPYICFSFQFSNLFSFNDFLKSLFKRLQNKYRNVRERVEMVEWNKRWSPPIPCCPENLIEQKTKNCSILTRLTLWSKLSSEFLRYQPRLFFSLLVALSQLVSPLAPSLLLTESLSSSHFGCTCLCVLTSFRAFLSNSFSSSTLHCKIPVPYLNIARA